MPVGFGGCYPSVIADFWRCREFEYRRPWGITICLRDDYRENGIINSSRPLKPRVQAVL
jgi:hypothetical protein